MAISYACHALLLAIKVSPYRSYSQQYSCRSTSHTRSASPPPPHGEDDDEEEEEEEEMGGSLGDLRLSESELSSFRRDDKGRISITKKSGSSWL